MMRPILATLLSASFALQLLLTGGRTSCADSDVVIAQRSAPAVADPAADRVDAPADQAPAHQREHHPDRGEHHRHPPCEHPAAPESCQLMASCGATIVLAAPGASAAPSNDVAHAVTTRVLAPPTRAIPPELPPPRA